MIASKILRKKFFDKNRGRLRVGTGGAEFGVTDGIRKSFRIKVRIKGGIIEMDSKFCREECRQGYHSSFYFKSCFRLNWGDEKVEAIYNGINLSFNPIASGCPIIQDEENNFRRTPSAWKGFATLIKIMKNLPDWQLIVAGRRSYEK